MGMVERRFNAGSQFQIETDQSISVPFQGAGLWILGFGFAGFGIEHFGFPPGTLDYSILTFTILAARFRQSPSGPGMRDSLGKRRHAAPDATPLPQADSDAGCVGQHTS